VIVLSELARIAFVASMPFMRGHLHIHQVRGVSVPARQCLLAILGNVYHQPNMLQQEAGDFLGNRLVFRQQNMGTDKLRLQSLFRY
jgi:hypothetical protein